MSEAAWKSKPPIEVNGRTYTLWSQFVNGKEEWIGGRLQDFGDPQDRALGLADEDGATTEITDITLEPNGKDSAMFTICGKEFSCGFDVQYGGITPGRETGWLEFSGIMGHRFRIQKPQGQNVPRGT